MTENHNSFPAQHGGLRFSRRTIIRCLSHCFSCALILVAFVWACGLATLLPRGAVLTVQCLYVYCMCYLFRPLGQCNILGGGDNNLVWPLACWEWFPPICVWLMCCLSSVCLLSHFWSLPCAIHPNTFCCDLYCPPPWICCPEGLLSVVLCMLFKIQ